MLSLRQALRALDFEDSIGNGIKRANFMLDLYVNGLSGAIIFFLMLTAFKNKLLYHTISGIGFITNALCTIIAMHRFFDEQFDYSVFQYVCMVPAFLIVLMIFHKVEMRN